jgi:hypothetical protein
MLARGASFYPMKPYALLGWIAAAAVMAACSAGYGKVNEMISSSVRGDSFSTIVVIAADDDQNTLQINAKVRQQLIDKGISAQRRAGMWPAERDALDDICPVGSASGVDGLLFVSWNELSLFDCRTHKPAYQIRGGMTGTDLMVQRLMRYLRPRG